MRYMHYSTSTKVLTIRLLGRVAGPESGAARLVVCIYVRVRAVVLEVRVVLHAGRRASRRSVVRARAAVGRVTLVSIEVGYASGLEWS